MAALTIISGAIVGGYLNKYYHTAVQIKHWTKNYIHLFYGIREIALQLRFMQIP